MENSTAPTVSVSQNPQQNKSDKGFKIGITIALLLIGIGIVLFAGVYAYQVLNKQEKTQNSTTVITATPAVTVPAEITYAPEEVSGVFYYIDYTGIKSGIYSYNIKLGQKVSLYLPDKENISLYSLQVINNKKLGFGLCEAVPGNFNCSVNTLDIETRKITEQKKLDKMQLLNTTTFFTPDEFAYSFDDSTEADKPKMVIMYIKDGKEYTVDTVSGSPYGRRGDYRDGNYLSFSPNGSRLLAFKSSSPRNTLDFNAYVYDFSTMTKKVIENATHPQWRSEDQIVYSSINTKKGTDQNANLLRMYVVSSTVSQQVTPLKAFTSALHPEMNGESILFMNHDKNIAYFANVLTGEGQEIANAGAAIWVTKDIMAIQRIAYCDQETDDTCGMYPNKTVAVDFYDKNTLKRIQTLDATPDLYSIETMVR